jgi:adenylate kinase family enzyme
MRTAGSDPKRIIVYGVSGSGKTTLAGQIGDRLGLPWHSIDDLTWEPGWVMVPEAVQRERIAAICGQDAWVIDAAYSAWVDIPLASVELIVGLDLPRWRSLGRLVRRTLRRMITREPVCNGNHETLRNTFAADSILLWHFRSFQRKRVRMRGWHADPAGPPVVLLRTPSEVAGWLDSLGRRPSTS